MEEKNIDQKSGIDNLPKARVGQPYRFFVDDEYLREYSCADCRFSGLEEIGLHFVPEKRQITGVPQKSGFFEIQLHIVTGVDSDKESILTRKLDLLVEDDFIIPLEDTPSDENDPYWKPDEEVAVRIVPALRRGWKKEPKKNMAAASKRGRQHIQTGKFREDDFDIMYDPESRWYVLAVADGSGAAEYSRRGSQIACETAVELCSEQLSAQSSSLNALAEKYNKGRALEIREKMAELLQDVIASSVVRTYREIEEEAANREHRREDYATTLLLCICKKFEFGWFFGVFWVGDGAVCIYNKDTWYAAVPGAPDGGESPSAKRFLTMPEIMEPAELSRRIKFTVVDDFTALFLMTNGVSDPKFETAENIYYFEMWNKFWKDISTEVDFTGKRKNVGEKLLKWLDFWTPEKHDDRTIAVIF